MFDRWVSLAAFFGATAVMLGAFGAHGLADRLPPARLASWDTAVQYHLLHAVALLALSAGGRSARRFDVAAWCFGLGIALFSGSIYGLVLFELRWLGPVTPIGGVLFIAGWIALAPFGRSGAAASS